MARTRFVAISILAVAALVRFCGIGYYPFKDEAQLALSALLMDARGMVDPPVPNWPPLLYYLNLGCLKIAQAVGVMDPTPDLLMRLLRTGHIEIGPLHWLLRGVSVAIGTLTVGLLFVLARGLFGVATAALAALLLACSWLHVAYSHFPLTDGLTALATLGSVTLAVGAVQHGPRVRLSCSMLLAGVAVGAKYLGGLAALAPLGAAWAIDRADGRPMAETLVRWLRLAPFLVFGIAISMPGLPFHPAAYLAWLSHHASDMGAGWEGFETSARGWLYHLQSTLRWGLSGLHVEALALAGIALLCRVRSVRWTVLPFLAAWWLVVGATRVQFARYWVPVLPPLCLAAALALRGIVEPFPPRWRRPLLALSGCAALAWPAIQVVSFDRALSAPDTRTLAAEWFKSRVPRGAVVATLFPMWFNREVSAHVTAELTPESLRAALADGEAWRWLAYALGDTAYPRLDPFDYGFVSVTSVGDRSVSAGVAELRAAGARYFVWSSFKDGIVEEQGMQHNAERIRFLEEVRKSAKEIAVFDPAPGRGPDPGVPLVELETRVVQSVFAERGGPLIRIYRFEP